MTESLKERFDKAFYGLLEANKKLNDCAKKLEYAGNLIQLNKIKQQQIKEILK